MGIYKVLAKRFPDGEVLDVYDPSDAVSVNAAPTGISHHAPRYAHSTDPADTKQYEFLYWDTGRHVTNKRLVSWTFNHPLTWAEWDAVAWYGPPAIGGGAHTIITATHWIDHSPINVTAIEAPPASSFVNGPGAGQIAWPLNGNAFDVDTEWGPAKLHALAHVTPFAGGAQLDFVEWIQLIYGGDDSGSYSENDDSPPAVASPSMVGSTPPDFTVGQNASMLLLAAYISEPPRKIDFRSLIDELLAQTIPGPILIADPAPEDWVRRHGNEAVLEKARSLVITGGDLFAQLGERARTLSAAQRREAIAQVKSAIRRGEATLHTLEMPHEKQE